MSGLAGGFKLLPVEASRRQASGRDRFLSPAMVCELVPTLTEAQLKHFRAAGKGPAYSKVGRRTVYAESDVRAWVALGRVATREQS